MSDEWFNAICWSSLKFSFVWNFHNKKVSSIKSNVFWNLKIWLRNKNKRNEYSINALGSLKCFNPMLFLLLIKNWYFVSYGSLAYKNILSVSRWLFIKFNNAFVFPDPERPIISILYGWSGMYGQSGLCFVLFLFAYHQNLSSIFSSYYCLIVQYKLLNLYFIIKRTICIVFNKKVSHYHHFTLALFNCICSVWICCNIIKCL